MLHELTLKSLQELDAGRVYTAWQQALQRCIADCEDRPGVNKARSINLVCSVKPVMNDDGTAQDVKIQFKVTESVPDRQSRVYSMGVRKRSGDHTLVFNDLSDDNIGQRTFPEADEAE